MVTMPEELIHLLTEWHTVPVATTGPDGKPNIAGKSVMVINPDTIVWGELYFMQTYENLTKDPRASICVWKRSPPFTAYKVNGRVIVHENDEIAAQLDERVRTGHGMEFKAHPKKMAAVYFSSRKSMTRRPIRRLPENGLPDIGCTLFPPFCQRYRHRPAAGADPGLSCFPPIVKNEIFMVKPTVWQ